MEIDFLDVKNAIGKSNKREIRKIFALVCSSCLVTEKRSVRNSPPIKSNTKSSYNKKNIRVDLPRGFSHNLMKLFYLSTTCYAVGI